MAERRGNLEPGERDRIVTIQQRPAADAVDTSGAPTDDESEVPWTTLVQTMPVAKIDLTGFERFRADQLSARYDTRWEMNYRADMDPELVDVAKVRRLVFNGKVHDIVAASQIGRREGIELMTIAKVDNRG